MTVIKQVRGSPWRRTQAAPQVTILVRRGRASRTGRSGVAYRRRGMSRSALRHVRGGPVPCRRARIGPPPGRVGRCFAEAEP